MCGAASCPRRAGAADCQFALVDAARTSVHMIDQFFSAVSRQLDWDALILRVHARAAPRERHPRCPPDAAEFTYRAIAGFNDDEEQLLRRRCGDCCATTSTATTRWPRIFGWRCCVCVRTRWTRSDEQPEKQASRQWLTRANCG